MVARSWLVLVAWTVRLVMIVTLVIATRVNEIVLRIMISYVGGLSDLCLVVSILRDFRSIEFFILFAIAATRYCCCLLVRYGLFGSLCLNDCFR